MHRLEQHREDRKRFLSESRLAQDEMMQILQAENPEVTIDVEESGDFVADEA